VPDDGEVQWGEVVSRSATILVEGYVQLPVEIVFDPPMRARGREDRGGIGGQGCNVEARLDGCLPGFLGDALAVMAAMLRILSSS